jgi:cell wall-associated NlpC family hydrolase
VNGYPQWGPPRWGPPPTYRRSGPPLSVILAAAIVAVFLYGWKLAPTAGRVWADLSTGHFQLQLPKVQLPKFPQPGPIGRPRPPAVAAARAAVAYARGQLGKPYVWGANGPGSFDCSGLTFRAWQAAGLGWGDMTAAEQYAWLRQRGAAVAGPPASGDLVFYGDPIGHVAIVSAPGQMIEAPGQGEQIHQVPVRSGYRAARPGRAAR